LNNVDLKIFSKMLHCRLIPYLEKYSIHFSQYAVPGRKECELHSILRDMFHEMKDQSNTVDSFLLGIDFSKAFDSVITEFLYSIMEKMGFPKKFISIIKAIDVDATARVVINGAASQAFNILRGSRQGDPLSMDKFTFVLNPLLIALHKNNMIQQYRSFTNKKFLT